MKDMSKSSVDAREILKPLQPCKREWPRWLKPAIEHAVKAGKINAIENTDVGMAMSYVLKQFGGTWSDHLGVIEHNGNDVMVSYPYAEKVDLKMMQELEEFCSALGMKYQVSANSDYFPGRTIAIFIGPNDLPIDWPPHDVKIGQVKKNHQSLADAINS